MKVADTRAHGRRWSPAFACWCAGVSAFQVALAMGAPWGAAAWGGGNSGVLPDSMRLASGVAAVVFAGVGAVAAGRYFGDRGRRRVLMGAGAYATLGIVANGISPSVVERAIWTPVCAIGAAVAFMAWREAARATEL